MIARLTALSLTLAIASQPMSIEPINAAKVGIIGDSISVPGSGPSGLVHDCWWQYLEQLAASHGYNYQMACEAVGGEQVTEHFAAQLDNLLASSSPPQVVLAMGGVNDLANGKTHAQISEAMDDLEAQAADQGVQLYWLQPPGVFNKPDTFGDLAWDLTHEVGCDNETFYMEEISDIVHPTGHYHFRMALEFFQQIF